MSQIMSQVKNLLLKKGDTLFFSICLIINMFLRRN